MKVAVIGTGFGKHATAPAYQSMGFDVEVVSPRDGDAVKRVLASDADLISVHSPPFMPLDHVTGAIEQGHAVLCDKPFGRNADEATEMRDRAREAGVLHFLNFEFRRNKAWAKVKHLAHAGSIGTPGHLNWTFFGTGLRGRKYGWISDGDLGGWIDDGVAVAHAMDRLRAGLRKSKRS